ncbi:hypothetical protein niasHS_012296 [Heterodera schachtii]|uniref:Niemann-Pick C1 N-terminal domain-containing protein n=1 Tax=Heterodera schachtii TaxID=97005 RepID=A0ABD2J043_HETSC
MTTSEGKAAAITSPGPPGLDEGGSPPQAPTEQQQKGGPQQKEEEQQQQKAEEREEKELHPLLLNKVEARVCEWSAFAAALIIGIILLLLCLFFMSSKTADTEDKQCVMRGICGKDGELRQNCRYEKQPVPVNSSMESEYSELCPQLFKDGNTDLCCDDEQFDILKQQLVTARQILWHCPSCYANFVNFWCQFACSPYQAQFVEIVETRNDAKKTRGDDYVTEVDYYVHLSRLDFSLRVLCGTDVDLCTPERLFRYIGTYSKINRVPFTINVMMLKEGQTVQKNNKIIRPMDTITYKCDEVPPNFGHNCECVDCHLCKPSPPQPPEPFPVWRYRKLQQKALAKKRNQKKKPKAGAISKASLSHQSNNSGTSEILSVRRFCYIVRRRPQRVKEYFTLKI